MSRCGLRNSGNDCFMNASIQCLAVSPFIRKFIKYYDNEDSKIIGIINKFHLGKYKADDIKIECDRIILDKADSISKEDVDLLKKLSKNSADFYIYVSFKDLIKSLNTKKDKVINNSAFLSITRELSEDSGFDHLFNGSQNDPHEFMAYLLDRLHRAKSASITIEYPENMKDLCLYSQLYLKHYKTKYEEDYSYFVKHFYYYILNCVECSKCKNKTHDVSPNDIMCVSIPSSKENDSKTYNIYDCLNEMFKVEVIDYKCEKCQNTEENLMEKRIISQPKTSLIIKIKKYEQVGNRLVKNNKMIYYPELLNIQQYFCGQILKEYELYGIVNHIGSLNGGHYYSYIRDIDANGKFTDQWLCCDDSKVYKISTEQAMLSQNAYVLFYNICE